MDNGLVKLKNDAKDIFMHSLKYVSPYEAIKNFVRISDNKIILGNDECTLQYFNLEDFNRIFVIGAGKAGASMAKALEHVLGDRITEGIVNVKYGFTDTLSKIRLIEAGHPVPDKNGELGTIKILSLLKKAAAGDLVFSLISGGGSALLPCPVPRITLEDKQNTTKVLLECGATINEINAVRKHISGTKGGRMAMAAAPATVINLVLSDVVGDKLDIIASGPFIPDESSFHDVSIIFEKYGIKQKIPITVTDHIEAGITGNQEETPKYGEDFFQKVHNTIIGSNILALKGAASRAEELGYTPMILSSMIEGESREVAKVHTAIIKEVIASGNPAKTPLCLISGGETTVTIKGSGKGGRNQEFCLAGAIDMHGLSKNTVMLSGGTDGNDGPTDAAGAIADTETFARATDIGLNPCKYLAENDSYNFFKTMNDLLITGPTNTNVMDIRIILIA